MRADRQKIPVGIAPLRGGWRFWVDRGGTFTDLVGLRPDGTQVTHKLLSADPLHAEDAAVRGIRQLLGLPDGADIPAVQLAEVRMGTTVGTNALLERRGEPTLLAITRGFADALRIGYQDRPHIFALQVVLPQPLYAQVVEIDERVRVDGTVERPLDEGAVRAALRGARSAGISAVAVALMHGYRHPAHERIVGRLARAEGFTQVSLSHETIPLMKLVSRAETTVVDAYLSPILRRYVDSVGSALGATPRLFFMQSHGGLTDARSFRGKDCVLSGPAGGIVGAVETCRRAGFERIVSFDMGGTSTDVAHYAGAYERSLESTVAGVRLRSPMLRIHTVAAGGGSICAFADGRYRVGPRSAGADPGPACYRRGGPLTVTDCNVVLGKLLPEHFPHVFGPGGDQSIDRVASWARIDQVVAAMRVAGLEPGSPQKVADDLVRVAVDNMARAIRQISTHRGYDIGDYTLCCFGAAAGQHACLVAESLGMRAIVVHPLAGVLSAYGMGLASVRALRQRSVEAPLDEAETAVAAVLDELAADAVGELVARGAPQGRIQVERRLLLKYRGTDMTIPIDWDGAATMCDAFARTHRERYGFTMDDTPLMVDAAEVEVIDPGDAAACAARAIPRAAQKGAAAHTDADDCAAAAALADSDGAEAAAAAGAPSAEAAAALAGAPSAEAAAAGAPSAEAAAGAPSAEAAAAAAAGAPSAAPAPLSHAMVYAGGRHRRTAVYRRQDLPPDTELSGPAIIVEPTGTTVVEPGWRAAVLAGGELLLTRRRGGGRRRVATDRSPLQLEIFNNLFMSCAEQMGAMLANTARSVNVKERLDFSCAIFDEQGRLIANAPHLPVHLGSMGETVRVVLRSHGGALHPGDAVLVNSPYHGGTHLPDLTVVSPVWADPRPGGATPGPLFYVAARAHHADIGGLTPGSMPPHSRTIHDEGVLISDFALVREGLFREADLVALLSGGAHPARNVAQNVADLKAQVAANSRGAAELRRTVEHYDEPVVRAYVDAMREHAEDSVRRALCTAAGGAFTCALDDGDRIVVRIDIDRPAGSARIDFTGTSPQRADNFNAPRAVTVAAVLYVVRTLVDVDIPLNEGCLAPLELVIPDGCLLAATYPAAVVAGNVEISQLVTDALLGAFGVLAGSQGTMNNLTFGDGAQQYYETICGGVGAGAGFAGCSAVHSHMTNSRLTDPEVLEWRHPLIVEEFAVRRGSGGVGRWAGGGGARRRLRFLAPMTAAIVSGRRVVAPHGLDGGGPGAPGRNAVLRADGTEADLGGVARLKLAAGDTLLIETPGGGGYGSPPRTALTPGGGACGAPPPASPGA